MPPSLDSDQSQSRMASSGPILSGRDVGLAAILVQPVSLFALIFGIFCKWPCALVKILQYCLHSVVIGSKLSADHFLILLGAPIVPDKRLQRLSLTTGDLATNPT